MAELKPQALGSSDDADAPGSFTPEAFAGCFRASYRTLWCIAAAIIGDRAQADDVVQDSAMVGLNKLSQFDPATNFTAWMGQIVRYVAMNHTRRARRRPAAPVDPLVLEARESAGEDKSIRESVDGNGDFDADNLGFDDRVVQALMELEATPRICLLLRTVHDMPYRDIALALDMPEGTAMSHVHRARQALRHRLAAFRTGEIRP